MQVQLIIQAIGFSKYTPHSANTIPYNFATIYLPQDCTLDITDHFDHEENAVPFSAGYHPLLFKKIRAISTGSVYLCHNGKSPTLQEMLSNSTL